LRLRRLASVRAGLAFSEKADPPIVTRNVLSVGRRLQLITDHWALMAESGEDTAWAET
jgi:hypothetical protein